MEAAFHRPTPVRARLNFNFEQRPFRATSGPMAQAPAIDQWLIGLLFAFGLGGGLCISMAIPLYFGVDSRPSSIACRGIFSVITAIIICRTSRGIGSFYRGWMLLPLSVFWILYLSFTSYYCLFTPEKLPCEAWAFAAFLWGTTFFPMIAFFRDFDLSVLKAGFYGLFSSLWLQCFLCTIFYKQFLGTDFVRLGSAVNHQSVQPLILGYSGAALILLSMFICICKQRTSWWMLALALSGLNLGGICVILSASRGPLMSLAFSASLYLFTELVRFKNIKALIFMGLLVLGAPLVVAFVQFSGSSQIDRMLSTYDQLATGNVDRFMIWELCWSLIKESPLGGNSIMISGVVSYAHNIILEAFQVGGIVCGFSLVAMSIHYWVSVIRILLKFPNYSWLALVSSHCFINLNVSGSMFGSLGFFACFAMLCNTWKWRADDRR